MSTPRAELIADVSPGLGVDVLEVLAGVDDVDVWSVHCLEVLPDLGQLRLVSGNRHVVPFGLYR